MRLYRTSPKVACALADAFRALVPNPFRNVPPGDQLQAISFAPCSRTISAASVPLLFIGDHRVYVSVTAIFTGLLRGDGPLSASLSDSIGTLIASYKIDTDGLFPANPARR